MYQAQFPLLADKRIKSFGSDEYPIRLQEGFTDSSDSDVDKSFCSN